MGTDSLIGPLAGLRFTFSEKRGSDIVRDTTEPSDWRHVVSVKLSVDPEGSKGGPAPSRRR